MSTPPSSAPQVRTRAPDDLPGLVAVLARTHALDGYPTQWPRDPAAWLSPPGTDLAWVATPGPAAGGGARAVGHVALVPGVDDPVFLAATGRRAAQLGAVKRLFVDPEQRGRGVARLLLDRVVAEAELSGLHPVLDVVDGAVGAIALYEHLGWRCVGRQLSTWATRDGTHLPVRLFVGPRDLRSG